MKQLTYHEQWLYCDPRFFELSVIIQSADSGSYFYVVDPRGQQKNDTEFYVHNIYQ